MTGEVYKTKAGQWAWRIFDEEGEIAGGAGYDSEQEAQDELDEQLGNYQ